MREKWTLISFLLVPFISTSLGCEIPTVNNAKSSVKSDEGGTKLTYTCLKGRLFGAEVLSCNASRQWDAPPPVCKEECDTPEKIPNAQLQYPHYKQKTFAPGSKVHYQCIQGFTKVFGESSAVCQQDFRWENATLICRRNEQSCPKLDLHNIEITSGLKASYVHGDTITIQCSPGFLLEGSWTMTCGPEGTWRPESPKCAKKEFAHCGIKLEDWKPALENEKRCLEKLKAELERRKA